MDTMDQTSMVEPLDEHVDHVRGRAGAPVILEYGDYECPYSRQAFRSIERVEWQLAGQVRFTTEDPHLVRLAPLLAAVGRRKPSRIQHHRCLHQARQHGVHANSRPLTH